MSDEEMSGGDVLTYERKIWYLRQIDLFRGLSDPEIEELGATLVHRTFRRGDLIVGPSAPRDQIYVLKTGSVRLFHHGPDGRQIMAGVARRGNLIGMDALFGPEHESERLHGEAETDGLLCEVDGAEFLRLISRWPQVMINLILQLGAQLVQVEQQLHSVASADARTRLAHALYQLSRPPARTAELDAGDRAQHDTVITQASLARQIGVARETVTRQLKGLERDGFVRREGRRFTVTDPEHLARAFGLLDNTDSV